MVDDKIEVLSESDKVVIAINALSSGAYYVISQDYFGQRISYHYGKRDSILMVTINKEQEEIFAELLKAGFVYLDTERDKIGYRSNERGLMAYYFAKQHNKKNGYKI